MTRPMPSHDPRRHSKVNRKPPEDAERMPFKADPIYMLANKAVVEGFPDAPQPDRSKPVYLGYIPREYFKPFHTRHQRFACIVAHRRAGKTVAALMDLIHRALKDKSGNGRFAFCGPTYAQIKDVVWQYLKQYTFVLPNTKVNEAELSVKLFNGATIKLYSLESSAYDRMRGIYLDGCTIDEFADCDPRALPEVIRPALSDRLGWLVIIGTSKGRDTFYKTYREATKAPEEWYSARIKASETKVIPASELDAMRRQMGPNEYARELECDFSVEGYDQFVSGTDIEEALLREVPADPNAPVTFGVDVARFGDDRTVVVVREGDRLVYGEIWKNRDLMFTAAKVSQLAERFRPRMIFVDGVGVGGGVVDRLKHLGYTNIEDVNVARKASDERNYANLRAECYGRMKDWLRDRARIHPDFPYAEQFEEDVTSLTYSFDSRGRLVIDSKDELKAKGLPSPDVADAVSLTFAQNLPTYDVGRITGGRTAQYIAPMPDLLDNWE